MTDVERDQFSNDAVKAAYRVELFDAVGGSRAAASDRGENDPAAKEVEAAKTQAEQLIKRPNVMERLCPALKSVSGDLGTVAKATATVLLPLSVGPQAVLSLTPLVVGALAVIAVRAGVSSLCPETKAQSSDE